MFIIARTLFVQEVERLYELGANDVIPEEFETSVEIFTRVLTRYLIPWDEIERFIAEVRADGYQMFRSRAEESPSLGDLSRHLSDVAINTFRVHEGSLVAGRSIGEIGLRKNHGITLLAIRRDSRTLSNPGSDMKVEEDDVLVVMGTPENLAGLIGVLEPREDR